MEVLGIETTKEGSERRSDMNELSDLFYYLESKTIQHPIRGTIPFKLYKFQKELLTDMYDNQRLLIIKCRQIGASTLLAGYIAWRFNRTGTVAVINSLKRVCAEELFKRVQWFEPDYPRLYTDGRGLRASLYVYDEWNYNKDCGKPYDHLRFLQPGQHIITGTVDKKGKLHELCKTLCSTPTRPFEVKWVPVSACKELWPAKRIKDTKLQLTPEQWRQEMECEWS